MAMSNQSPFGWTAQARSTFLASLATCGTVRGAAQSVNLSPQAAYKLRARDPAFARAWDAAITIARDHLVSHLTTVAFEGWTEEVWYKGELVGERHRHNPMVAMRLLERLDRMAEKQVGPVERFDTMLRAESVGIPINDPQVRCEADLEEQATAAECRARLYHARDLNAHLDTLRAAAHPPLCDHDDCPACIEAADALSLDPTADIAVSDDGTVFGCLYPDDLPNDDVRIGTIFDPWQAAREEAAMLADLGLADYDIAPETETVPAPNLALNSAQAQRVEGPATTVAPDEPPAGDRHFPALGCQPVSTAEREQDFSTDAQAPDFNPDWPPPLAELHWLTHGAPSAADPETIEKAAPPCEGAAHSVQPDGDVP